MEETRFPDGTAGLRLSNADVELDVTTSVGPRILRYAYYAGPNAFAELPGAVIRTTLGAYRLRGGHRLWAAPEVPPATYAPDDEPVEVESRGPLSVRLTAPRHAATVLQKEMTVTLEAAGTRVTVVHRIRNPGSGPVELAPWAITIVAAGATAILPQEPLEPYGPATLRPSRTLALWPYTDFSDPRWTFGRRLIRLRADPAHPGPQKIGLANRVGWVGALAGETLFLKRFDWREGVLYPDLGSNCEVYAAGEFLEVESLGTLQRVGPGESVEHVERWSLARAVPPDLDDETLWDRIQSNRTALS